MKSAEDRLADARIDERIARARWFQTLDELQDRVTPGGIAEEVWDGIQQSVSQTAGKAVNAAKERPFVTAAAGLGVAVFAFRKTIISAIGKRISGKKETARRGGALKD